MASPNSFLASTGIVSPEGFNNKPAFSQQLLDNTIGGNIGGIISTRQNAKYISGARTILRINSQPVAFAFNISWRIQTSYTEVQVLDNPLPEEFAPKAIRVEGSISALHIPGQSPGPKLWQADVLSFLFHQYVTIEVRDSATNQLLFFAPKAVITARNEDIKVDDLASISLNFMSIGFRDEKTPEIPDGASTMATSGAPGDKHVDPQGIIDAGVSAVAGLF